jgi:hypothetical protein
MGTVADLFSPIVEQCNGCTRIVVQPPFLPDMPEIQTCSSCLDPEFKWKHGRCNLATHIKKEEKKKAFVDPIKASKMMMKGKK